ncbi:hypothetical protein Tco_0866355 [Tanacetum coccineum]
MTADSITLHWLVPRTGRTVLQDNFQIAGSISLHWPVPRTDHGLYHTRVLVIFLIGEDLPDYAYETKLQGLPILMVARPIIRIKSLLNAASITAAHIRVNAA